MSLLHNLPRRNFPGGEEEESTEKKNEEREVNRLEDMQIDLEEDPSKARKEKDEKIPPPPEIQRKTPQQIPSDLEDKEDKKEEFEEEKMREEGDWNYGNPTKEIDITEKDGGEKRYKARTALLERKVSAIPAAVRPTRLCKGILLPRMNWVAGLPRGLQFHLVAGGPG